MRSLVPTTRGVLWLLLMGSVTALVSRPAPAIPRLGAEGSVIRVPIDEPTIMTAMYNASRGDTIRVAPGIYRENVMLRSGVTLISAVGPERTTLLGEEGRPVVSVPVGGRDTLLEGFTLEGGAVGVKVDGSSLDVQECHVRLPMTTGMECGSRGELYLRSCVVERCGTGVLVDAGGRLTLLNCELNANEIGVHVNSRFGRVLRTRLVGNEVGVQVGPRGAVELGGTKKFGNDFWGNATAVLSLSDSLLVAPYNSWGVMACDSIRALVKGNWEFLPAVSLDRARVLESCN